MGKSLGDNGVKPGSKTISRGEETIMTMHKGPNAGTTPEGIPALVRQWWKFQPIESNRWNDKPAACTQECGGLLPDPPAERPWAKMPFECGLGKFGACPVRKSINRRRKEALRYWLGLWKRSVRVYRSRLEAQTVIMENDPGLEWTSTPEDIARYSAGVRLDMQLYEELRESLNLRGSLDIYMMLTRTGEQK